MSMPTRPPSPPAASAVPESSKALLPELVAHLRQHRAQLQEE